jgi:Leucine-rich repeat (LRR) protein
MRTIQFIGIILLSLLSVSCGQPVATDSNTAEKKASRASTEVSQVSIKVKWEKLDDILYLQDKSGDVFKASGDGAIGEESIFDSGDSLKVYKGIPFQLLDNQNKELMPINQPEVFLSAKGDDVCENLFQYDAQNSKIKINASHLSALTVCQLKIKATASIKGIKNSIDLEPFLVTISPTVKYYYLNSDPFVQFLVNKFSGGSNSFIDLAKYLKSKTELEIDLGENANEISNVDAIVDFINLTSLNIQNSKVESLKNLSNNGKIKYLNISNTKISEKNFNQLSYLKNINTLILKNINFTISNLIPFGLNKLNYLDVSNNPNLKNINEFKKFSKLKNLIMENANISNQFQNLKELQLINLNYLDISNNNLSNLNANEDPNILSGMISLQGLNVSNTQIHDAFLQNYFSKLKNNTVFNKFIDRNNFSRISSDECKINRFSDYQFVSSIKDVINLEYLDIHGNSCLQTDKNNPSKSNFIGVINLNFLKSLTKLKYLDVSNNAIDDLSPLKEIKALSGEKSDQVFVSDNGSMTPLIIMSCMAQLGLSENSLICSQMPKASKEHLIRLSVHDTNFVVPLNVYSLEIRGCSGANGGAGAGGGGSGDVQQPRSTLFPYFISPGAGGNSGRVNNLINDVVGGKAELINNNHFVRYHTQAPGLSGGDGELGNQTFFGDHAFSIAHEGLQRSNGDVCLSGKNGEIAGIGGFGQNLPDGEKYLTLHGGLGGVNNTQAWNSKIESFSINVMPNQNIPIHIGMGGKGGKGGLGGVWKITTTDFTIKYFQNNPNIFGTNGTAGEDGANGEDGFIEIRYIQ